MTRVFFACSPSDQFVRTLANCDVDNVLISYAFIKKPDRFVELFTKQNWFPRNLIIDSGAFSVWANGQSIDIDSYSSFCKEVKNLLPSEVRLYCVNLDVLPGKFGFRPTKQQRIDSAQKGWENMLYLESKGLKVIHVYHQHESLDILERLRNHSDYIGLSPANDVSMNEKLEFLGECFSILRDQTRCHGFAVTSEKQLYQFPFFSADSSSWTAPARFGRIPVFMDNLHITSIDYKDQKDVLKYWEYLSKLGMDKMVDDYLGRCEIAVKSYQQLQRIATELWDKRGVKFKED